jgi:hypothetical protein
MSLTATSNRASGAGRRRFREETIADYAESDRQRLPACDTAMFNNFFAACRDTPRAGSCPGNSPGSSADGLVRRPRWHVALPLGVCE